MLPPGEETKLKDKFGNLPYDICANCIDSKWQDIKFKTVVQKAGDAIFVPSGWHHQVWNTVRNAYAM